MKIQHSALPHTVIVSQCSTYKYNLMLAKVILQYEACTVITNNLSLTDTLDYKYTSKKSGQMTVVIPAGHTTKSFDLTILEDIIIEDTESFQLSIVDLSLPHDVSVGNIPSATVNIIDNDCKYCISICLLLGN